MNWDEIWGNVKTQASSAWDQAVSVGLPVVKAAAEKQLIETLQNQHVKTTQEANAAIAIATNGPETALGGILKQGLVEKYKTELIIAVVGLIAVGYVIAKGK